MDSLIFTTVIASIITSITVYYKFFIGQKPRIHSSNLKMKKFLSDYVKQSEEIYAPAPFIFYGILQTVFALIRRLPWNFKVKYTREIVVLRDGSGQIGLDFLPAAGKQTNGKKLTVVFLPGLTSSSRTPYVQSLVAAVTQGGADVFVMNYRGIGGVPLATPVFYSAATINDFIDVLTHIQRKCPSERFLIIGTSFGGIILNRYLIKEPVKAKTQILGGLIISSPFDLEGANRGIEHSMAKYLINYPICYSLKRLLVKYKSTLKDEPWYDLKKIGNCRTVRELDRHIVSKSSGFESEVDYYAECQSKGKLHLLGLPIFALNAMDDPIQYGEYLPFKEAEAENSMLTLITTSHGGHLGFLEGLSPFIPKASHFMEKFTQEFVQGVLNNKEDFENLD